MTSVTRTQVLAVLEDFLNGRISKEDTFKWAESIVLSKVFDKLAQEDKLLSDTIQALWELHHEGDEVRFDPTTEELEYYRDCLIGKREY